MDKKKVWDHTGIRDMDPKNKSNLLKQDTLN